MYRLNKYSGASIPNPIFLFLFFTDTTKHHEALRCSGFGHLSAGSDPDLSR